MDDPAHPTGLRAATGSASCRLVRYGQCSGFTFVETAVALTVLGLVLTASFTLLDREGRYRRRVEERFHVLHAIERELETRRVYSALSLGPGQAWVSDPVELQTLANAQPTVSVSATDLYAMTRVRAEVTWGEVGEQFYAAEILIYGVEQAP